MIIPETFYIGEREYIRRYSDLGVKIHGGSPEGDYDVAEDPVDLNRTYTETNIPIEQDTEPETADKAEAYDILTGVEA